MHVEKLSLLLGSWYIFIRTEYIFMILVDVKLLKCCCLDSSHFVLVLPCRAYCFDGLYKVNICFFISLVFTKIFYMIMVK